MPQACRCNTSTFAGISPFTIFFTQHLPVFYRWVGGNGSGCWTWCAAYERWTWRCVTLDTLFEAVTWIVWLENILPQQSLRLCS